MAKIALVGLLATQAPKLQGCGYVNIAYRGASPQVQVEVLENNLGKYRLIFRDEPREGEAELGKGSTAIGTYENVRMIDRDLDGQVDEIVKSERSLIFPDDPSIRFEYRDDIKKFHPKVRAVYQKAFSNHQAAQRNYKK